MSMRTSNQGLDDGVLGNVPDRELYENDRDYYEAYNYFYRINHEPERQGPELPEPERRSLDLFEPGKKDAR